MDDERITSSAVQGAQEEANEQSLRPQNLKQYIGQAQIKHELSVYIEAAKKREEALDHVLLYGPPGLGKTTLAMVIANEMAVQIRTTSGPAIEKPGDLVALLNELQPGDILFIDEIHRLPKVVEEMLYSAMEDFFVDIVVGQGPTAHPIHFPLPPFTLIGATTRAGLLSAPLRDRFGIVEHMNYYTEDDLANIVKRSAEIFKTNIDDQGAHEIARRSRGTPRISNRLLKRVRDFAEVENDAHIDRTLVQTSLKLLQVDDRGLDQTDKKVLTTMIELYGGGPVGLTTIAANIGEEPDTISEMYEPYLLQIGFLKRTPRGRMVTERAYAHLGLENLYMNKWGMEKMTLTTEDFNYDLPHELIAQTPIKKRDASRMLVLDHKTGEMADKHFYDIVDQLNPGDAIVMNDSRVMPARIYGLKEETGGHLEVLLLHNIEGDRWETLVKPARRAKVGTKITFGDGSLTATVKKELDHGGREIEFEYDGIFMEILEKLGEMPLPPYIKEKLDDPERYQTVYSKEPGSAAAPTAGLHWTKELLQKVQDKGVKLVYLTLHVGLGTFRPVDEENIEDHKMHSEFYRLSEEAAATLNEVRKNGGRIIATGTTSIRTLETIGTKFDGEIKPDSGWTDIFIKPGYEWKVVDAFITNFHLPKSTLVMLVAAFTGREMILNAYKHAVEEKYRFFSFGDAMFIK